MTSSEPTVDVIERKLRQALQPSSLAVIDESHLHAGHSGSREGGQTHFRVRIEAAAFAGLSRVAIHRTINGILADELQTGVHALAIDARAGGA